MAKSNTDRVWFIIRGMTQYVNRMYKITKFGDNSSEISMEDLYLPRKLKLTLNQSLDRFMNEKFVVAHNHCAAMPNRKEHVKKSFRTGLLEIAKAESHQKFLRECVLYIMSATELEHMQFLEAKDIVMDAIYQACMNTEQHESLVKWETQPGEKKNNAANNLNNHACQHNHEDQPSSTTNEDVDNHRDNGTHYDSEVDILGM